MQGFAAVAPWSVGVGWCVGEGGCGGNMQNARPKTRGWLSKCRRGCVFFLAHVVVIITPRLLWSLPPSPRSDSGGTQSLLLNLFVAQAEENVSKNMACN